MSLSVTGLVGGSALTTASGSHSAAPTPAVGDLLLIWTVQTGSTTSTSPTDDQGGTYSRAATALKNSSADLMELWVRNQLVQSAVAHTVTHNPGTTTGGGLFIYASSGGSRVGLSAIRQTAKQENTVAATPAPVFSAAPLTSNAIIGAICNATNPAGMLPPTSFAETFDNGYGVPATGLEVVRENSGVTATTITWGSFSATDFCSVVAELDASAQPVPAYYYEMIGRHASV